MIQLIIVALTIFFLIYYYFYTGADVPLQTSLEDRVKLVSTMFPHVPKTLIENDLRNGSKVEQVCEKIMSGRLTATFSEPPENNYSDQKSLAESSKLPQNSRKDHLDTPTIKEEPPKLWESESDKRQQLLRQRKAFMIQQARLKFLNKD